MKTCKSLSIVHCQLSIYWDGFVSLFFPPLCAACDGVLLHQEHLLCASCSFRLPVNDQHLFAENEAVRRLRGKADVSMASAYLSFTKSSSVQSLIHKLKYQRRRDVGLFLGEQLGRELAKSPLYATVDLIVPIPIHKKKLRIRGYNQSEQIALGISKAMGLPVDTQSFVRSVHKESQTRQQRLDRYENVENVFACADPERIKDRHILLVDDVLTTGATMASAIATLKKAAGCEVSVATLAIA